VSAEKPAGYYPDPDGAEGVVRWWDGTAWTEERGTLTTDRDGWTALDAPDGPKTLSAGARPGRALTWLREEWAALRAKPHTLKVIAAPAVVLVVALGAVFGLTVGGDGGTHVTTPTTVQGGGPVLTPLPPACTRTGYSRGKFGNHPSTAVRAAVLYLTTNGVSGTMTDPYSGLPLEAKDADIDHRVPLAWAWSHGACNWPTSLRILFATDAHNLVPTSLHLNRQKSDQGPDTWLPPLNACDYVSAFLRIVDSYHLTPDAAVDAVYPKACAVGA
jgi:hypothetical protein